MKPINFTKTLSLLQALKQTITTMDTLARAVQKQPLTPAQQNYLQYTLNATDHLSSLINHQISTVETAKRQTQTLPHCIKRRQLRPITIPKHRAHSTSTTHASM